MAWNDIEKIFSTLTQNPTIALILVVAIISLWCKIDNGFGTAFRDIPKHLTEAIIATYNFILSLLRREQIDYPPSHNPTQSTDDAKSDREKISFKDKMVSLLKRIKG